MPVEILKPSECSFIGQSLHFLFRRSLMVSRGHNDGIAQWQYQFHNAVQSESIVTKYSCQKYLRKPHILAYAGAPFFFFLSFLPFLRSLFFKPPIPVLQASAYRTKNPSNSSGFTTVLRMILSTFVRSVPAFFVLLLLDARTRIGSGFSGCVSHSGSSATLVGDGGAELESNVKRFCVRYMLPWPFLLLYSKRLAS